MEFAKRIGNAEVNELPLRSFKGKIHMVSTLDEYRRIIPKLQNINVLGFDTETRPAFKKGRKNKLSLLQFSTEFHAFLFRTGSVGLPDQMIQLFEDENIMKIGAAVHDDLIELKDLRGFKPAGFLDLQKYVEAFGIENKAVAKMAGIVLGFRISKSQQLSNWDADMLSDAQKKYASTDAWVCYQIYRELQNYKMK